MSAWAALAPVLLLATISVAVELLELHGPDGQAYYVNAAEVSSLRQPTPTDLGHYFPRGTRCVVSTTNGKFLASVETCASIRDRMAHDVLPLPPLPPGHGP